MTTAPDYGGPDPRDVIIAAEIRAEIARQRIVQAKIAIEVFKRPPQWLSRRLSGEVPLTGSEILTLGDFLGVDVVTWLNATKRGPTGEQVTLACIPPMLELIRGNGDTSPPTGSLRVAS